MTFLYPFLVLLQPGILWPDLAPFRPILAVSVVAVLFGVARTGSAAQLGHKLAQPTFLWLTAYVVVQVVSLYFAGMAVMLETLEFWGTYAIFVLVSALL